MSQSNIDTERLNRDQALAMLRAIRERQGNDEDGRPASIREDDHVDADEVLLRYIADDELAAAFDRIGKWYA
jgi:hypothetical protein